MQEVTPKVRISRLKYELQDGEWNEDAMLAVDVKNGKQKKVPVTKFAKSGETAEAIENLAQSVQDNASDILSLQQTKVNKAYVAPTKNEVDAQTGDIFFDEETGVLKKCVYNTPTSELHVDTNVANELKQRVSRGELTKDLGDAMITLQTEEVGNVEILAKKKNGDIVKVDGNDVAKASDVFGFSFFTNNVQPAKSNATNVVEFAKNVNGYSLHLTYNAGYVGASFIIATSADYIQRIVGKKAILYIRNKGTERIKNLYVRLCRNTNWADKFYSQSYTFDKGVLVEFDFSDYTFSGTTNISLCFDDESPVGQDVTIDVCCVDAESFGNTMSSFNSYRLDGHEADYFVSKSNFADAVGVIKPFTAKPTAIVIRKTAGVDGASVEYDIDKAKIELYRAEGSYSGINIPIVEKASLLRGCKVMLSVANTSTDNALLDISFNKTSTNWAGNYGVTQVSLYPGEKKIIEWDMERYQDKIDDNPLYVLYRIQGSLSLQASILSELAIYNLFNDIPHVTSAYNAITLDGKSVDEITSGAVKRDEVFPSQLFTGRSSNVVVNSAENSITKNYENGVYTATFNRGAAGQAGLMIVIADNASTIKQSQAVLVLENTGSADAKIYLAISKKSYDWSAISTLASPQLSSGEKKYITVNVDDYRDFLGEGMFAFLIRVETANVVVSIRAYMIADNTAAVPVNKSLDSELLNGKSLEEIVGGNYITCWGDSLTAQGGWTARLQELSGLPVNNGGTGGENVNTITARQGADVMIVDSLTIPAGTTPVQLATYAQGIKTEFGKKATPLLQGGNAHVNPCKIGDIDGTLAWTGTSYNDNTGTWTFTRSTAGEAVVINRPTALRTNYDVNKNDPYIMILYMGQNGGYDSITDLVNKHRLAIEHSTAKHFLVLGLSSGTAASRAEYEDAMKKEFGRNFFSLREYLAHPIYTDGGITSCYGLADEGLTPTADDLEKIAVGQVPSSLLADSVHYTQATRTLIGDLVYKRLKELNIL